MTDAATAIDPSCDEQSAGSRFVASRRSTIGNMATVRLFAAARDAAGVGRDEVPGSTVDEVLRTARDRYGSTFEAVLGTCKIWVNGEPAAASDPIGTTDELAVLPPVSGGCT
jgi:molybdopterin converting factor small subunit